MRKYFLVKFCNAKPIIEHFLIDFSFLLLLLRHSIYDQSHICRRSRKDLIVCSCKHMQDDVPPPFADIRRFKEFTRPRFVLTHTVGPLVIDGTSITYRKRKCVVNGIPLLSLSDMFSLCFILVPQIISPLQPTSIDLRASSGVSGMTFPLRFFPCLTITCTINENVVLSSCLGKSSFRFVASTKCFTISDLFPFNQWLNLTKDTQ